MTVLILGGGAVGGVLAAHLAKGDRDVVLADGWFQHVEAVKRDGLVTETVEQDFTAPVRALNLDELEAYGPADVIVVATKSYDTMWMARLARDHLAPQSVVVSAQNGMNDLAIARIVGTERVVAGVVLLAAELVGPGHVKRSTPHGELALSFGELGGDVVSTRVDELARIFAPLGKVQTTADAWPERWSKLTLNVMSNAMAGLTGYTTLNLWTSPGIVDVLVALGHEAAAVAHASGIRMATVLGRITHENLLNATSVSHPEWHLVRDALKDAAGTRTGKRENMPSLLQDIQKGRRTEIDYLNGWICAQAADLGMPAAVNRLVVDEVHSIELGLVSPSSASVRHLVEVVSDRYS
jgi:2-dehydropantoate 2-reductase